MERIVPFSSSFAQERKQPFFLCEVYVDFYGHTAKLESFYTGPPIKKAT
jgi:hypothetical protein